MQCTYSLVGMSGVTGRGSSLESCLERETRGEEVRGWERQGDSKRAWPIPESSESWLTSGRY